MKPAIAFLVVLAAGSTLAQEPPRPVRVQIRHADPWFVKAMLEGQPLVSPEISTLLGFSGGGALGGAAVNQLIQGGTFMVNAGDNSLWFIPVQR